VVFEVQKVADDDPCEETGTMARQWCPKLPVTVVRSDQRLSAGWA
jgi:hypothetical protein